MEERTDGRGGEEGERMRDRRGCCCNLLASWRGCLLFGGPSPHRITIWANYDMKKLLKYNQEQKSGFLEFSFS